MISHLISFSDCLIARFSHCLYTYGSEVWSLIAENRIIEKFVYLLSKTTQGNFDCPFCEDMCESEIQLVDEHTIIHCIFSLSRIKLCLNQTEIHFLLVCSKYSAPRERHIRTKLNTCPSACKMALLLADTRHTTKLAVYVSKAFAVVFCFIQ